MILAILMLELLYLFHCLPRKLIRFTAKKAYIPEKEMLKLSDADLVKNGELMLELKLKVININ